MTFHPEANSSAILTGSQIKALLTAALDAPPSAEASAAPGRRLANAQRLLDELATAYGESCPEVLAQIATSAPPLDELRAAKDIAKRLLHRAETAAHRDAVTLLYHAAVAAAFAYHGEHISAEPIERRKPIYADLARIFSGQPIGEIFRLASR